MNQEDIIRMAREADAAHDNVVITPFLARFAALIAKHERESIIKMCNDSIEEMFEDECNKCEIEPVIRLRDAIKERNND